MSTTEKVKLFTDKLVTEMLAKYYDEEAFHLVITEAVAKTVNECANLVEQYNDHRIPASEYKYHLLAMYDPRLQH